MLHSIYDLTTFCRPTTGDVPAKLVGASTTVVGSKMYLFGGRLVSERRMVSDLYSFDLQTFRWEKVPPHPDDDVPRPRYFHSADTWNNQLIIFGGMSNQPDSPNPDELCVLNDVRFFDLNTRRWVADSQVPVPVNDTLVPRARYAHLSSVTADRLFIIGGQDFFNTWLDDVCVYDLVGKAWVQRREYPRHCGTYRSVAVSSNMCVRLPQEELRKASTGTTLGSPGSRFRSDGATQSETDPTSSESLIHLPYSCPPTEGHPSDIFLYSNYNFTDVKRELEVFSPLPDTDFTISDRSGAMSGSTFPPGLRFPTGAILGTHLIIAGTYLAHSYQSFSIWVLDLLTMTWSRIDPGKAVESGSWFRGSLWAEANKFLIFGNRHGNLVDDYNRRLLSWDHVAVVDLEAFGIYQPPPLKIDVAMQELGLAAQEEKVFTDFEIICDDGRRVSCSRKLLEERWPWLKEQFKLFNKRARDALQTLPTSPMHVQLPDLPGSGSSEARVDPRLTPRSFQLSEPYPITLALMQYFYSLSLITPLQHAPAVLSQLLVLSTNYKISHLEALVKHAMHRALSNSTSVGVYEVATLCSCRSLQIRALKTVMSYTQKRPGRSRADKDGGSGGKPSDGGSGGGGGNGPSNGGPPPTDRQTSRPRGTSDARWPTNGTYSSIQGNRKFATLGPGSDFSPSEHDDELSELQSFNVRRRPTHHARRSSVVSIATEDELHAVAELMSPTVNTFHGRNASLSSTIADSEVHYSTSSISGDDDHILEPRDPVEEMYAEILDREDLAGLESPGFASSSDDEAGLTRHQLRVPPSSGSFHLPRRPRPGSLTVPFSLSHGAPLSDTSDTPSLVSSSGSMMTTSPTSSLRTPSVSSYTPNELSNLLQPVPERHELSEWMHDDEEEDDGERISTPSQLDMDRGSKSPMETLASPKIVVPAAPSSTLRSRSPVPPNIITSHTPSPAPSDLDIDYVASPTFAPRSPASPTPSSSSKGKNGRSLSRLLSPTKSKSPVLKMPLAGYSTSTVVSTLPIESKASKADDKRRKKEEAKARMVALAEKMQSERKAKSLNSDRSSMTSSERGRKREPGIIYGGMLL